jgi:hypothetical protein
VQNTGKKSWKSKIFGDNTVNFYGWIVTGVLVFAYTFSVAWHALKRQDSAGVLFAIFIILSGMFALQLQNYHARLSEKLDSETK